MKRSMPVLLSFALLFGAFGVPASAEDGPDRKKEYLDLIVDDYSAIHGDERDMTTYPVMNVASSGVPFIYVSHRSTAGGGAFCYVDGDKVVTERTAIVNFEYIEGSDAFFETGGPDLARIGDGFTVEADSGTATVTGDAVRVRSGPGTDHIVFTELYTGDRVSIIGRSGDWYHIEYADPYGCIFRGFMRSDYIAKD